MPNVAQRHEVSKHFGKMEATDNKGMVNAISLQFVKTKSEQEQKTNTL